MGVRDLLGKRKRPKPGEQTKAQTAGGALSAASRLAGLGLIDPGTYDTYRLMSSDPTLALAIALSTAPIKGVDWQWEHEEGYEEAAEYLEASIGPIKSWLVTNALKALEFGWAPFELIHG